MGEGVHVEVDWVDGPLFGYFGEEGGDEAENGGLVGKETGDAGAAFDFEVDAFEGVGGSEFDAVGRGKGEDGKALGEVVLHPGGEFWGGEGVGGSHFFEAKAGGIKVGGVKDSSDVLGDLGPEIQAGDVSLGVLLEMKLASLPGDGWEDGGSCGAEAGMVVADDEGDAVKAALLEAGEELAPVGLGLAEGDADAENGAFAEVVHTEGDEDGAVDEAAAVADALVTGVKNQIREGKEGACAPGVEFGVEFGGAVADLGGADGGAA